MAAAAVILPCHQATSQGDSASALSREGVFISPSFESGFGHGLCFGQLDVRNCDMSRYLKNKLYRGLAPSNHWGHFCHHDEAQARPLEDGHPTQSSNDPSCPRHWS